MAKNDWTINITRFLGFCPAYADNSYPFVGNKSHASAMTDISLIDPSVLTQGPGVTDLTGGLESGELGENLIVSILKHAVTSNATYACSADKVFKVSATAVLDGDFPLSITGGTYQVATDLIYYKSNVYVFWNDTGTEGEIAKVDISAPSIDVDWGSTTPTGAAHLQDAPHYAINGGDDIAYFTNGQYIGTINGTTLTVQGLDFWTNAETVSVTWNWNRVLIAVNRPNISGSNFNQSGIYRWNGVSPSWEGDPIEVSGEIGALYTKNGRTFVWWKDGISTGGYNFGFINGLSLQLIQRYSGSLPNQPQVGEYEGFIGWLSDNELILWGARDASDPVRMFAYLSPEYETAGTWAAPFGTPLISSEVSTVFTAATSDIITSAAHGLVDTDTVFVETTSALPTGLSANTLYYVIDKTDDTFKLSTSSGGSAVDITGTGTGVQTWHRYSLSKASGYATTARWKSVAFNMRSAEGQAQIDKIQIMFETLSTGAKVDTTITYDQGASTESLTQIAYSATDATTVRKILNKGLSVDDFRVDLSWENGSVTNPVKIRSILIKGHWGKSN